MMIYVELTLSSTANMSAGKKALRLEQQVTENQGAIDRLRQERDGAASEFAKLQRKYAKTTTVSLSRAFGRQT